MKYTKIIGVGLLLMMLFATGCVSPGDPITETDSVEYSGQSGIEIDGSSADLYLIREDRDDVYIEFDTYEDGQKLKVSDGDTIRIETKNRSGLVVDFSSGNYRLYVHVPEEFDGDLFVDLSSGDVEIDEFELESATFDLSSGDVNGSHFSADYILVDLSSGDVDFDHVVCDELETDISSGRVELTNFTGRIIGKSSSGNVSVSYLDEMDMIDYRLSSGDMTINYNNVDVNADFDLDTSSGDVSVRLSLDEIYRDDDDSLEATVGTGEYSVKVKTSSGDITIKD